jgi:hypothetical protein
MVRTMKVAGIVVADDQIFEQRSHCFIADIFEGALAGGFDPRNRGKS